MLPMPHLTAMRSTLAASIHQPYNQRELTHTFSYIVEFRGGTYCCQVTSKDLKNSLQSWLTKIKEQKEEIKFLGDGTLKEIAAIVEGDDYQPVMLKGLKNIWFMHIPTAQGGLHINVVKTDIS
jgi:hypothetical protein